MSKQPTRLECHLTIEDEASAVLEQLQQATGLSRQKIKQAMQKGAVWLSRGKHTRRLRRSERGSANSSLASHLVFWRF